MPNGAKGSSTSGQKNSCLNLIFGLKTDIFAKYSWLIHPQFILEI
jgi:hypothetical protein